MSINRAERPWYEDMPIEPQRYREGKGIPMKKQKCMNTMSEVWAINRETRAAKVKRERGISVLKELVK